MAGCSKGRQQSMMEGLDRFVRPPLGQSLLNQCRRGRCVKPQTRPFSPARPPGGPRARTLCTNSVHKKTASRRVEWLPQSFCGAGPETCGISATHLHSGNLRHFAAKHMPEISDVRGTFARQRHHPPFLYKLSSPLHLCSYVNYGALCPSQKTGFSIPGYRPSGTRAPLVTSTIQCTSAYNVLKGGVGTPNTCGV